jgi:hypothetical protein
MAEDLRSSLEPAPSRWRLAPVTLAVAGLLLCCCGVVFVLAAWNYGDAVLEALQGILQLR